MVSGTVKAISKPEDGKVAITVYSTRYIDSIYTTSKVSAELLTESSEGIKVPSSSLRVIDGQQGVYVVRLEWPDLFRSNFFTIIKNGL